MRRAHSLSLLAALAAALLPAAVAAAPSARERIEALLSHYERQPSREALLAITPEAERVLQDMIQRPSMRVLARTRAIAMLRLFPSTRTAAVLRETVQVSARASGGVAFLDLKAALSSYAAVAGPASIDLIQPFLAHSSMDVRYAAVASLASVRSPRVAPLLEARRRVETSPMVRHHLERELTRLRAR